MRSLPSGNRDCAPSQLTQTSVERYLSFLTEHGYSVSHRIRVKTVINGFCQWLIEEKQALHRNPTRGVEIKAQQTLAPRILHPNQRFVLRTLVEKEGDLRGKAIFALGYWAGSLLVLRERSSPGTDQRKATIPACLEL